MSYFFDRDEDVVITTKGNLPHWHQEGKIQYVTWRLADSLPQCRLEELRLAIAKFKEAHPEPWSTATRWQYRHLVGAMEERLLDNGYGSCLLRQPDVRRVLTDVIHSGHGVDYEVLSYVVMPNHVHLLMKVSDKKLMSSIMHRIKGRSGFEINRITGRHGALWMRESFDHIVRNDSQLKYYLAYIKANPKHLPDTDATHYVNQPLIDKVLAT